MSEVTNEIDKVIEEFKQEVNHGLDIEKEKAEQSEKDWIFGAVELTGIAENIPEEERINYLPVGEVQRGKEDMVDCATRGPINILETKFNWLFANKKLSFDDEYFLRINGYLNYSNQIEFSDAFIAILSGTTRQGNSMRAPLDTIRKNGLIPKKMLSLELWMAWQDYHNPMRITREMTDIGLEFVKRFSVNYEKVYEEDFERLVKKDLLNVGGYAWPSPINGVYPKVNRDPNHVFVSYKNPKYYIFDNYIDSVDGDFTKKLASDYDLMDYGYRILVKFKEKVKVKSFRGIIINWLREIFK